MKIVKIEKTDGREETRGCLNGAGKILEQLKDIWLGENLKNGNFEIVDKDGDLYIGGDHSITYDIFSKNKCEGLLVLDAHPDVYEEFKTATHLDWLKFLIDEKKIKAENVMIVGIRSFHKKEIEYLRDKKVKFITMKSIYENGFKDIVEAVMESSSKFNSLYLSIDIDVVDPAFAPGVGYIEPGGLSARELIYFIHRIKNLKNLRKVDIVEVNVNRDFNDMTAKLAAKLIYELI